MPGKEGPFELRQYGFREPHDPGEAFLPRPDPMQEIFADFVFD